MGGESIPLVPAPLSADQAEAMEQHQLKKHHVAIMLLHWFNAIVWLLELTTGAALIVSPHFRFVPQWFIRLVGAIFGTHANLLHAHIAIGIAWIVVFAVYGTFGFRTYLAAEVLHREIAIDWDDIEWLIVRALNLIRGTDEELPPQGIYNAGQKLFAFLVYAMIPVIMGTGLIMAFHLFGTRAVAWAVVIHFGAVGFVVSGLVIHVYMGAVFPEEKAAFFSMLTGMASELYAYRHHFKWWREVRMQEQLWREEISGGKAAAHTAGAIDSASLVDHSARPGLGREGSVGLLARSRAALRQHEYWPPYAAGFGLGLALLATFVLMGEGLGASGGFTRYLVALIALVAPNYAATHPYWSAYYQPGQSPLMDFLVFELIGAAIGGFVSGWLAGRLKVTVDKGPRISPRARYALALGGGILTGVGARLARGCTSGLALSGGAVLSVGAFVFMLSVFAAGFVGAYFMRRVWL